MNPRYERWLWRAAMLAVLGAILVPVVADRWRTLAGGVTGSTAVSRDSPCLPGSSVPVLASPHISRDAAGAVRYNSTPPTSGPHFAFVPAMGVYDAAVPDGLTVHALEHGHIAIQYAPGTPPLTVAELADVAKRYSADVVLAPYPGLDHGIALTAWGRLERLDTFDGPRITRFVEALRGRYDHGWTRPDHC
ncbi:DUF3105 domain-containing protein [Kitasatospora sp. McL0602]|uniref:DUF3105 domain-containing protein n=1 Tax=Kitasatospora sp. McL0602 TaxID=3439530 RepID=UPI003F8CB3BF